MLERIPIPDLVSNRVTPPISGVDNLAIWGTGRHRFWRLDYGMPKRSSTTNPEQPDPNQVARSIVDQVAESADQQPEKNPAAVALGRMGGKKGGPARAAKLSAEERSEIARKAAKERWRSRDDKPGGAIDDEDGTA